VERARITVAKAELDAAVPASIRSRYDHRTLELAETKARADHRKAEADLLAAATAVDSENRIAEEQHRKAERELEMAEEALAALSLTAPRAGIIVVDEHPWEDRKYQVGDTAFPGWTVLGIPNLEQLRVRASLSDVDDGLLEVGMAAECTPDIEPGLHLRGRITEITPIAREQRIFSERRGFDVTVELDDDPGDVLLVPGMSVRVDVADSSEREHLLVPRAALDLDGSPPRAQRRSGSWTEVEIGSCSVHDCILIDGLSEGDRLRAVSEIGS